MAIRRFENTPETSDIKALAQKIGFHHLETVDLEDLETDLIRGLPLSLAREQQFLPLWKVDDGLVVAISQPYRTDILSDIELYYQQKITPVLFEEAKLLQLINQAYDKAAQSATAVMQEMEEDGTLESDEEIFVGEDLLDNPQAAPMVRFVNSLLSQAIKQKASDIHIEPFEKDLSVRLRVDGVLQEVVQPPRAWKGQLVSRIKVMANLDIAKKNIPQDGRIRIRMAGREVDNRVSTLPVRHAERVVMRLLEKKAEFSMETLGMNADTLDTFREMIRRPYGIILVCGPTGSGKTTTLYSALSEINSPDKNILTIEDPIEYELRGIGQTQVMPKIGLTFGRVIRAHLRQDPDIILVGETRDKETAENAIQASLTGHLVFSTIHTNDAATAFTRLVDMGIEPFLVATSLVAILAQRLVRKLCDDCKEPFTPTAEQLRKIGIHSEHVTKPFYKAVGCPKCGNKGYRGRMGIYELLIVDEDIRRGVASGQDAAAIKNICVSKGMRTLRGDGNIQAMNGKTTIDEVLRITAESME
ncbi:MAG: type II secretion system ATPase GspE [Myxococcota bacterium]|nr:type II secretion system ATPase GspE [Myxococcota bacterium]